MNAKPVHKVGELRLTTECCVVCGSKILVQKRPSDTSFFPNYLTLPGGHVDEGEDLLSAVVREVIEETSIQIFKETTFLRVSSLNHHIDRREVWAAFGFYSEIKELGEPKSTDEGDIFWMDIQEFLKSEMIFPPIKYYMDHILHSDNMMYMSSICEAGYIKEITSQFNT